MFFLLSFGIEFAGTAAVLLPTFLILHFVYFYKVSRTILCFMFSLYLGCIYFLTGLPTIIFFQFEPNIYLVPFLGIVNDLCNSLLNILLFLPLGFLIPLCVYQDISLSSILLTGLLCSLFVELMQLFASRLTDINDLITNTIGTLLGYFLSKLVRNIVHNSFFLKRRDICLTISITVLTMFFLQPLLVNLIWKLIFRENTERSG